MLVSVVAYTANEQLSEDTVCGTGQQLLIRASRTSPNFHLSSQTALLSRRRLISFPAVISMWCVCVWLAGAIKVRPSTSGRHKSRTTSSSSLSASSSHSSASSSSSTPWSSLTRDEQINGLSQYSVSLSLPVSILLLTYCQYPASHFSGHPPFILRVCVAKRTTFKSIMDPTSISHRKLLFFIRFSLFTSINLSCYDSYCDSYCDYQDKSNLV